MTTSRLIKDNNLKSIGKTVSYLEDITHNVGIYKWTNNVNGKVYVGQTDNLERREKYFTYFGKVYAGDAINKARNKYNNVKYWDYEVLEYCTKDKLDDTEIYYIALYDSSNRNKGYNLTNGGKGGKNILDEIIQKNVENRKIAVLQIDINTNLVIKEWKSSVDVQNCLGYDASSIRKVCKGKRYSCNGYKWRYKYKQYPIYNTHRYRAVLQINPLSNEVINEFQSLTKAAYSVNGKITLIYNCCVGKQKQHKGYKWQYKI